MPMIKLYRFSVLSVCVLLLSFSSLSAFSQALDHDMWDDLLKKYVVVLRDGQVTQVNYHQFSLDRKRLEQYLEALSQVSGPEFDEWAGNDQLAFLINAYNAWTIELILRDYPDVESIKDLGSFFQSPWKKKFVPLLGEVRSLDDIEHGLIRSSGRYNDPRIHFAVNCASIGCPALSADAYRGEFLDHQLEQSMMLFLMDRSRNKLRVNSLDVSLIFKWYRDDFSKGWRGAESLEAFFELYQQALGLDHIAVEKLRAGTLPIKYTDYDWRLNKTPNSVLAVPPGPRT